MKVIYHGEEIEIETELEKGARELDMLTPDEEDKKSIDMDDTIEVDEETLNKIKEGNNE